MARSGPRSDQRNSLSAEDPDNCNAVENILQRPDQAQAAMRWDPTPAAHVVLRVNPRKKKVPLSLMIVAGDRVLCIVWIKVSQKGRGRYRWAASVDNHAYPMALTCRLPVVIADESREWRCAGFTRSVAPVCARTPPPRSQDGATRTEKAGLCPHPTSQLLSVGGAPGLRGRQRCRSSCTGEGGGMRR